MSRNVTRSKITAPRSENECVEFVLDEYMQLVGVATESTKYLALIRRNIGEIIIKYFNPEAAKIKSFDAESYESRARFRAEAAGVGNGQLKALSERLVSRGIPETSVSPKTLRSCMNLAVAYTIAQIEDMILEKKHSLTNLICAAAVREEAERIEILDQAADEGKTTVLAFQRMFAEEVDVTQLTPASQVAQAAADTRREKQKKKAPVQRDTPDGRSKRQKQRDEAIGIHNNQSIASQLSRLNQHLEDHVIPSLQDAWTAVADDIMNLDEGKERDQAFDRSTEVVHTIKGMKNVIDDIIRDWEKLREKMHVAPKK